VNGRFPQKQNTSEKLKAKQYGAAALICILVAVIMTIIRLIWGSVMLGSGGDQIPLGMVIFLARNIVLLFGAIDLVSAIYHFILWNRNGRHSMDDDNNGLFSDWQSGERSPVKVSLVLMAGIMVLALVFIVQA
jgi:predicted tellurium resistance membrane protein TerC